MSAPSYAAIDCVRIAIRDDDAKGMQNPSERVICRLLDWQLKQQPPILGVRGTSAGSAWWHVCDYTPAEAIKVLAWLKENGIRKTRKEPT